MKEQQNKTGGQQQTPANAPKDYALADKLLAELAGRKEDICNMMGVRDFYIIEPEEKAETPHLGGVAFRYGKNLVKNKSNVVRIFALPNGKRRMEWNLLHGGSMVTEDSADNIIPEMMEHVWWEHTACAVRTPWILDVFKQDKFELGKTLMTPGVEQEFSNYELANCLKRHRNGDWGDVCEEDKGINDQSLKNGSRLLSVYKFDDGRVLWIITEAKDDSGKRAATTLLLPDEY